MSYLDNSNLDFLRIRRYGATSRLKLLEAATGGYRQIILLTKNFFIGRVFATQQGAYVTLLTLDRPTGLTYQVARDWTFVDLVLGDDEINRYRVSTETRPTNLEKRWVVELTAAFNDTTPIVN